MVVDRDAGKYSHLGAGAAVVLAMMTWAIIGSVLAGAAAYFMNAPVRLAAAVVFVGLGLGICLGPYAALGTTRLARILWAPCQIMAVLICLGW